MAFSVCKTGISTLQPGTADTGLVRMMCWAALTHWDALRWSLQDRLIDYVPADGICIRNLN